MDEQPRASVVFATHNRAERLAELLESLAAQTVDRETFEVIAVDDGSSDATAEVLAREQERGRLALTALRNERPRGPAAARNTGWRAARAPLVAFTDDDCTAAPGWLASGLEAFTSSPGSFLQGRTDPAPAELHLEGPFSRTLRVHEAGPYFQTCNVMYPLETLQRLGGFDEETFTVPGGEDADLAWRAMESGSRPVFVPGAQVFHAVSDLGPAGKLRVAWRWSETMRIYARHPELRRRQLTYRVFWKGSHYLLFRAIVAALLPRRLAPVRMWLARPYLLHLFERGRVEGGGPLLAPYFLLHDLVEMAAALRGSVRYRTLVL
jgi:glycosyltransferase involved in cell wall biosynthesis